MTKLILGSLVAITATFFAANASAQCMIYSKADYQGAAGIIQPNDFVKFFEGDVQFSGVPADARTFTDVSWRDNLGSVKLTNGCQMITYDEPAASTKHRRYINDSATLIANQNTEVSTLAVAAHCSCK